MLYHASYDPDLIDEFCNQIRLQSELKTRLLFEVMSDIIFQSIQKGNTIFQIKFANFLYIHSTPIFQSVQKRINLEAIKYEISTWGTYQIYTQDFINRLLTDLKTHSDCLQNDSQYAEYIKNRPSNEDINQFLILLQNKPFIRKMYEFKMLNNNITDLFNELIKEGEFTLDRVSDTFKNLKSMIQRDLVRREKAIQEVSNQVLNLFDNFFEEENLKQAIRPPNKKDNVNNNLNNNNL